jgi:hypothetical protein
MIKPFALLQRAALLFALSASLVQTCTAQSLTDLLSQLTSSATSTGDATLKSLGSDLSTKATALNTSLKDNPTAQTQLQSGVQSLLEGNGAGSLGTFSKLAAAKLTPEQTKLAKEVGNLGSAYVVQKNFSALEGAQGDVATIVKSLRKGDATSAVPALGRVAQNAKLTSAQKDLVGSLADKYAPGAKKFGSALEGGLKSIPGFGK